MKFRKYAGAKASATRQDRAVAVHASKRERNIRYKQSQLQQHAMAWLDAIVTNGSENPEAVEVRGFLQMLDVDMSSPPTYYRFTRAIAAYNRLLTQWGRA